MTSPSGGTGTWRRSFSNSKTRGAPVTAYVGMVPCGGGIGGFWITVTSCIFVENRGLVLVFGPGCNVEAECPFCYLRWKDGYIHESCCLGVQRHLPTYMKRIKCQDGHDTYMRQRWYQISVTLVLSETSTT